MSALQLEQRGHGSVMARVTVAHLEAVLHAIECMSDAVVAGAEDPDFIGSARLASEAHPWVMAEIRRRKRQLLVRKTLAEIRMNS